MKYIVYILFSTIKNRYYNGYTSNLEERIIHHNQKSKHLFATYMGLIKIYIIPNA